MSNSLLITKRLTNDGWSLTGRVNASSDIPKDIFVYLNTGTTVLGTFESVVMVQDLPRIAPWTGAALPVNRNRYVRFSDLKILVPRDEDVDLVIQRLVDSAKMFTSDFNSVKESTKNYVID